MFFQPLAVTKAKPKFALSADPLSVPMRDSPPCCAIPFQDSIAGLASHTSCRVFMYPASIAEMPHFYGGIVPQVHMPRGRGIATNLKLRRSKTHSAGYNRHRIWPGEGSTVQWKWSPPSPGSLKALLFPPLLNKEQTKGTQGVRARYDPELPPIISIVRCPGRPVILGMDIRPLAEVVSRGCAQFGATKCGPS